MTEVNKLLSKQDCQGILQQLSKNCQLEDFKIVPFHSAFDGFIGEHYTLQIDYREDNQLKSHRFFLKTLSENPIMYEISRSIKVYEKEKFFYMNLMKEYEKYNIDSSFAPKGYFFKPYLVVLEDAGLNGYRGTSRRKPLDLEHCKVAVATIAEFHAASIIYETKKGEELGKTYELSENHGEILENKIFKSEKATKYFRCSVRGLFQLIDLVPENSEVSNEEFKQAFEEALEEILCESNDDMEFSCVKHGDLWSSNFLYVYDESGKPTKAKLVDYQTISYGPPQLDLLQFIMTTTRKEFRDKNFRVLVEYYYTTLSGLLIKSGCNEILLSDSEFFESCEMFKLAGKVLATIDRAITLLPDGTYANALKSEETFRNFLFEERGKYIVDSFTNDPEYKDILHEDLLELKSMLFATNAC